METKELRGHIENIINYTFETIDEVYKVNQEINGANKNTSRVFCSNASRLVFPKYRGKDVIRVSEQELRFLFIEEFNKYIDIYNKEHQKEPMEYYYSIETPTENMFSFKNKKKTVVSQQGESAQFDIVIFNKIKERVCLIEFKNNSSSDARKHEKDFFKLSKEGDNKLCYFISIAEASDSGTLSGIINKLASSKENQNICFENITYICHCLNNRGKKVKKGFDTVYAGTLLNKEKFDWVEKKELFEK